MAMDQSDCLILCKYIIMQVKWFVKNYQPGKSMVVILAARQGYCNHGAYGFPVVVLCTLGVGASIQWWSYLPK